MLVFSVVVCVLCLLVKHSSLYTFTSYNTTISRLKIIVMFTLLAIHFRLYFINYLFTILNPSITNLIKCLQFMICINVELKSNNSLHRSPTMNQNWFNFISKDFNTIFSSLKYDTSFV